MNKKLARMASFLRDKRGNIAILFALTLPLMAVFAGGAVDFQNRARVQVALQEAADAGALAAAFAYIHDKDIEMTAGQAAHRAFALNFRRWDLSEGFTRTVRRKGNEFIYRIDAEIDTNFLKLIGVKRLEVDAEAAARIPELRGTEIAIIIDSTNSMGFGNSWTVAMNTLTDVLEHLAAHSKPSHFYVSLVPYADRVNVGTAQSAWLDAAAPGGWNGCVEPREEKQGKFGFALGKQPPTGSNRFDASISGVTGGLASRGAPYPNCPNVPITGPTSDPRVIADAAKKMTKSGTGRMDEGLAWGWRLMASDWNTHWGVSGYPAAQGNTNKIAVFITDGHTTAYKYEMSKTEDWGSNNGSKEGFEHMVHVCDQMKKDKIEIYVFRINGNANAEPYFQDCATDASHYRLIETNEDLEDAFQILIDEDEIVRLVR